MVDTNRPIGWRVIDMRDQKTIVATFETYDEAGAFCRELQPQPDPDHGWLFTMEPVRATDMIL